MIECIAGEEVARQVDPSAERDHTCWEQLVPELLEDAIAHLQDIVFTLRWPEIRARAVSDEEALRASLLEYERGLIDIFGFVRVAGIAGDGRDWSAFKVKLRQASRDAGEEISLRSARDEALYYVERHVTPGDQATYAHWRNAIIGFLRARLTTRPTGATHEERINWAAEQLRDVEEHVTFNAEFTDYLYELKQECTHQFDAALDVQQRLMQLPRFDLVLNLALRWVAECA